MNVSTFEKFDLVAVHGLQSEAGKKLNGGQGIVLRSTKTPDDRYAIRIYALALGDEVRVIPSFVDKSIKAVNLQPCPELAPEHVCDPDKDLFSIAAHHYLIPSMADDDLEFWLEAHHRLRCHESFALSITYSSFLRDRKKQHVKAAQVLDQVLDQHDDEIKQDPRFPFMCRDFVYTFVDAGQDYLGQALKYAMAIPEEGDRLDTEGMLMMAADGREDKRSNRNIRRDALHDIVGVASRIVEKNRALGSTQHVAELHLKACQALVAMEPTNPTYTRNVGTAFAHCHKPMESVRWYRHAIRLGASMDAFKESLLICQLESPGMMLDGYHVVSQTDDGILKCLRKRDLNKLVADTTSGGFRVLADGVDIVDKKLPTNDPDDPMFAQLLESLENVSM